MVTNTLKIMGATMLLSATSNDVGVNVRLVGYGLSISRYQHPDTHMLILEKIEESMTLAASPNPPCGVQTVV